MKAIILDEKAVRGIIHQFNHLKYLFIPDAVLDCQIKLTTGQICSLREIVRQTHERVGVIAEYLKAAQVVTDIEEKDEVQNV